MKLLNKARQDWNNFISTVRSKRFWYTIIGFIGLVGLIYVVQYTFISVHAQQRAIIGIALQILAGSALILDQVFAKKDAKGGDVWGWLIGRRSRFSTIVCLVLFLVGTFVWVALSGEGKVDPWAIFGSLVGLMVIYIIYLYGIQWVVGLLERWSPRRIKAGIESNIIWANGILFCVSLLLVIVTGFFIRLQPDQMLVQQVLIFLWFFIFAFIVLPVFLLSGIFLSIVVVSKIFVLVRQKVKNQVVFWLLVFALWLCGGLLLLANVWA